MFVLRPLGLCLCSLCIVVAGGAGSAAASVATTCGSLVCVTVEDSDGVSPSGTLGTGVRSADIVAYQFYKVTVANAGHHSLANVAFSIVLTDSTAGGGHVVSTAAFVSTAGSHGCVVATGAQNRVDCALGSLGAGLSSPTAVLAYRTSTTLHVTSTDAVVTVAVGGSSHATSTVNERTSVEQHPQASASWSPSGRHVALATSPTADSQFTTLGYAVPPDKPSFGATLSESTGALCAAHVKCFGQVVTTDLSDAAAATFTPSNPFHLRLTLDLALIPGGDAGTVVLSHRLDSGAFEVIRRRCSSSPPAAGDPLPCLSVRTDAGAGVLVIDVWAFQNGGWQPGLT